MVSKTFFFFLKNISGGNEGDHKIKKEFPFDISLLQRQVLMLSMGKSLFSSSTEAYFNHAVITARDWFV